MAVAELHDLQLLRTREAAELFGISVRQFNRLVKAGRIRAVKLSANGQRRWRLPDVVALVTDTDEEGEGDG